MSCICIIIVMYVTFGCECSVQLYMYKSKKTSLVAVYNTSTWTCSKWVTDVLFLNVSCNMHMHEHHNVRRCYVLNRVTVTQYSIVYNSFFDILQTIKCQNRCMTIFIFVFEYSCIAVLEVWLYGTFLFSFKSYCHIFLADCNLLFLLSWRCRCTLWQPYVPLWKSLKLSRPDAFPRREIYQKCAWLRPGPRWGRLQHSP